MCMFGMWLGEGLGEEGEPWSCAELSRRVVSGLGNIAVRWGVVSLVLAPIAVSDGVAVLLAAGPVGGFGFGRGFASEVRTTTPISLPVSDPRPSTGTSASPDSPLTSPPATTGVSSRRGVTVCEILTSVGEVAS